ncbi:GmrSD restriction endonuclease domain-containing protein [Escherichia fergusonii]|uniref:GmrSD restriction endonuclease domain-containing protein n=1 Tax=Escherichia fergusonii TaxID=564 RepID=UPI0034CFE74B
MLLSPGDNSSYSNQSVAKKKADFEAKPRFDSLKLRAIFRSKTNFDEGWTEKNIKNHKNAMIQLLTEHYGKNSE